MILPEGKDKLLKRALEIIEQCRVSSAPRAALARSLKQWRYTGSPDGNPAILNYMNHHLDRMAGFLFSPADLRYQIEFENHYPPNILKQGEVAARVLTREIERRDIDMQFAEGVDLALTFGSCIYKLMWGYGGVTCKLVMPWQFGVYREDLNGLDEQEAVLETSYITLHDLWRRISHLPDAVGIYKKARDHAKHRSATDAADTYFHQVLLAGTSPVVQTDPPFLAQPGGLVQVTADPTGAILSPDVADNLVTFHELTVLDDDRQDYTTIQIVEPDILICPLFRRRNLFVPEYLPYGIICPNKINGYIWGRPEMADLMKLQQLLRDRMEDIKKTMALQYDRLLSFTGFSGMNDEAYDEFRQAGWIANEMQGAKVEDLTPKLPPEAFAEIKQIITFMEEVSGFQNVMSGRGEEGVRAAEHARTLMKTGSPRLRDRALLLERAAADLGDKTLELLAAKSAKAYWTEEGGDEFTLSQLPDDRRVVVDSHSSSPIYEDDHMQLAAFLMKAGAIDGESLIDLLPVPMKDTLKARYRAREQQKAQFVQEHPEVLVHGKGKGKAA